VSAMPKSDGPDRAAGPPDPDRLPHAQRARRDRIVRAAIDLLDAAEYEAVQMREVAARAGVALGTLYRYFSSKEHLYAAALVSWSSEYGQPRRTSPLDVAGDEARLRALLRRAVRAFERSPQMLRVQSVIERSADPNAAATYDAFAAANTAVLTAALRDLDPATARAVINTVQGVLSTWLRSWAVDRCTIREVDAVVQDAIGLIFGGPPETIDRPESSDR
jgi:TetR/AcrR family transcriptional regulator, cholesterol catabolism regulator